MVKMISRLGSGTSRILMVATLTGMLVGCGGSSGDSTPIGEQDFDNDDIINSEDDDADGDDILDTIDPFVDLDGDGFDDITFLTVEEATGSDVPDFTEVSDTNVCGSENGSDNDSSNNAWLDNCIVKRSVNNGQFADSLFSVGIQRVLFCTGHGTGTDYTAFADGEYGPGSETAMKSFQNAEGLVDDGVVGPQTWAKLQTKVEVLTLGTIGLTPDTYGFTTGVCADIPMFYQHTSLSTDGLSAVGGLWELAKNQPAEDQRVPFSIALPFNQL